MASVAATAGFGKGTEESWNNGANLGEGLAYGSFSALWEGLQFYIGGEISKVGGVGDKIAQKLLNGEAAALKTKIAGSLTRVILDGADGGIEGFVQPLLQSIYKDESYAKLFEENGGWGNVAMQTAMGAGMSAFSEIGDMRRILKSDKNVNVTTNINDTLNLGEKFSFFSKNKDKKHFIENIFYKAEQVVHCPVNDKSRRRIVENNKKDKCHSINLDFFFNWKAFSVNCTCNDVYDCHCNR